MRSDDVAHGAFNSWCARVRTGRSLKATCFCPWSEYTLTHRIREHLASYAACDLQMYRSLCALHGRGSHEPTRLVNTYTGWAAGWKRNVKHREPCGLWNKYSPDDMPTASTWALTLGIDRCQAGWVTSTPRTCPARGALVMHAWACMHGHARVIELDRGSGASWRIAR